jgi:hypothetical protein
VAVVVVDGVLLAVLHTVVLLVLLEKQLHLTLKQ